MVKQNSTNTYLTATTTHEVTMPLQPSFQAYNSTTDSDVTGDGTVVSPVEFDSEVVDQNDDYNNTTDTFTAPVTGIYNIGVCLNSEDYTASHTKYLLEIVTSNATYILYQLDAASFYNSSNAISLSGIVSCDMDNADTAIVRFTVSNGTQVVDIIGGASRPTVFFGSLKS